VGKDFAVGIKLNSADFQKGGFTHEESIQVAEALSKAGIDLLEISGGSYEAPAMMDGKKQKESTKKREAYFLEYAQDIKNVIHCPLMVTGGFRTKAIMVEALEKNELDLIGLARPLAINPNFANDLIKENAVSIVKPLTTGIKGLDKILPLEIIWYTRQLHRMGKKKDPNPDSSVFGTILHFVWNIGLSGLSRSRSRN